MATITAAAGGGNWNVGSTWVGGVVPLTTDDVVLNATSGQVTISATAQCKDINFSGYTNTITFNANLTITGNLTRNTSVFSYLGTGGIIIAGTTTQIITTTSVAWTIPVTFGGTSPSISINGAFNITAPLTLSSTTSPVISRANVFDLTENVNPSGNITISGNGTYTGSANIVVSGSNNQTLTASGSHQIRNNLTIDKTGGVLSLSGTLNYNTGTLTYVASGGTVNTGSSTLNIGASTTLNTNGITWNNILSSNTGTTTITLSSNLVFSGTLSLLTTTAGNVTFSGIGILSSTLVANVSLGHQNFGGASTGASTINFPSSTILSITNLTVGCGGATAIGYNTTANNVTFNISGNLSLGWVNQDISRFNGTSSQINMIGTGTLSANRNSGTSLCYIVIPFNVNTSGTITLSGNVLAVYFEATTIAYTLGTITGIGAIFIACTLNLNDGGKWGTDVIIRGNTTLTSNATFGNITTNTTAVAFNGAFTVNVEGNLAINIATSGASTSIVLNGTGAQSWTHGSAVYLSNNLTINKASGTLTLGANVYYRTGTFTYIASGGTVDMTTNANNFYVTANGTFNANILQFNNFVFTSTGTSLTLQSDLNITGILYLQNSGAITFIISVAGSLFNPTGQLLIQSIGTITLPNNISITNFLVSGNTSLYTLNSFNINISGNITVSSNFGVDGSSNLIINGTGNQTWSHTGAGIITKNLTINKSSGTLTLGANVYYTVGTLTYTQGDVDVTTNNNTFFVTGGTYNVEGLNFNTFYFATSGVSVITLASNLYARTFTCGGNSTINGAFDIYCSYFNMNNSSTGQISASLSFPRTIYCAIDTTFSGATATNVCTFTGNLYVGKSCYHNAPSTSNQGAANLFMVGNGELRAPSIAGTFISNLYFNTSGKVTITGSISYALGAARTINLIRGNIDARKATLTLNRTFTHTLINMNKMVWGNVVLDTVSAQTLNMNEFFCGDATTQTNITASTTTNAIVTFTDNFEKIAKFVNINGITFTRPQQLLLLTNQPKKTRNIGIRYNNSLANGVAKGDPSVQNLQTVGQSRTLLLGDPAFVKSI